jgi:hypothetical protein
VLACSFAKHFYFAIVFSHEQHEIGFYPFHSLAIFTPNGGNKKSFCGAATNVFFFAIAAGAANGAHQHGQRRNWFFGHFSGILEACLQLAVFVDRFAFVLKTAVNNLTRLE